MPGESVPPRAPAAVAGTPCRSARPCPRPPRGHVCGRAHTGADPRTPLLFLRRAAAVPGDLLRLQPSPVPTPLSGGSLLYLLMRPPALEWAFRFPTYPAVAAQPRTPFPAFGEPRGEGREGKGCFFIPSMGSLSRPLRTPCKLIRAAQWYSVLIHIGFTVHKLLNCSCFGGQCGIVPDCRGHKCSGDFLLCMFLSVRCRHEPINVHFIIQRLLGERSP